MEKRPDRVLASGMNFLHRLLLTLLFSSSLLWGEKYYVVSINELKLEGEDAACKQANVSLRDAAWRMTIRTKEESYLGFVREQEQQWWVLQGLFSLAIKCDGTKPVKGFLDLRGNPDGWQTVPFTFDPNGQEEATEEEFNKVKSWHYWRLAQNNLPGTVYFQHRSRDIDEPMRRNNWRNTGFADSFAIFSGGRAISENLALDRDLLIGKEEGEPVPVEEIKGVTVPAIDWTTRLPEGEVAVDPLSFCVPEDQHAVFLPSMDDFFKLIRIAENDGAALVQGFTVRNPFRKLLSRYRSQMGLDVMDAVARLMPVKSLAVTGGDPFFPTGSDVAVLYETDSPDILFTSLSGVISAKAKNRNASEKTIEGEGFTCLGYESPDRKFSSYVLRIGNLIAVANSPRQIHKIVAVHRKKEPALGTTHEFQFFRHRYPAKDETAYIYLSDATIRRWAGPQIRIGASRRARAMRVLGSLTAGQVSGEKLKPGDTGMLGKITAIEEGIHSEKFGTLQFITPVSELEITTASKAEKEAYEQWRRGYEQGWAQVFDPIAIQLNLQKKSHGLDMTVLPLSAGSDYEDFIEVTGNSTLPPAARTVPEKALLFYSMAIDKNSRFFQQFDAQLLDFLPSLKANPLSWVGESVTVHFENGVYWDIAREEGIDGDTLGLLPVAVRVDSKSRLKMALFIAALKASIETSAPDAVSWETRRHNGQAYIAVKGNEEEIGIPVTLYYATMRKALLLSFDEDMLHDAMDREGVKLDEKETQDLPDARQVHFEASPHFLMNLLKLADDQSFEERRQLESWKALPMLNEWHRIAEKGADLVKAHQHYFGTDIHCPGGKGYRWNEKDHTMESIAYGHPGNPKLEGKPVELLQQFANMRAGLTFEDGGVRIQTELGPTGHRIKSAEPKLGPKLGEAKDYVFQETGKTLIYKQTLPDTQSTRTCECRILKAENKNNIRVLSLHTKTSMDGKVVEENTTTGHLGDSLSIHHVLQQEDRQVFYSKPEIEIPADLRQGAKHILRTVAEIKDGESTFPLKSINKLRVVGLETIETPAGKFENCLKLSGMKIVNSGKPIQTWNWTAWYAKGLGRVKFQINTANGRFTSELESIREE